MLSSKVISNWIKENPPKPLLVVLGPTASGKTDLAIELAQEFDGEIISADSRQIYKELDKGTAKPTLAEMQKKPHHLISEFSPKETITVAKYRELAENKIEEILKRKKLPILCGSHTLLISALVENYQFPGEQDTTRRHELTEAYKSKNGAKKLWEMLKKIDSAQAKKIPPENQHHLIRAIERAETGEKQLNLPENSTHFSSDLTLRVIFCTKK